MATYSADTTSTSNPFGTKFTSGATDDYTTTRFFSNFITDGSVALADIALVQLKVVVSGTTGGGLTDVTLYWDVTDGFGTTLTGIYEDFVSTYETLVDHNISWTSTGTKYITVDKNTLNLNGNNWWRLNAGGQEGTSTTANVTIYSQNNTTQSNRPQLIITLNSGAKLLALTGVGGSGGAGGSSTFYGISGDGFCREVISVGVGVPYVPENP